MQRCDKLSGNEHKRLYRVRYTDNKVSKSAEQQCTQWVEQLFGTARTLKSKGASRTLCLDKNPLKSKLALMRSTCSVAKAMQQDKDVLIDAIGAGLVHTMARKLLR